MTSLDPLPISRHVADALKGASGVEHFAEEFRSTTDAIAFQQDLAVKAAAIAEPFTDAFKAVAQLTSAGSALTDSDAASGISAFMEEVQRAAAATGNFTALQSMASDALSTVGSRLTDIVDANAMSRKLLTRSVVVVHDDSSAKLRELLADDLPELFKAIFSILAKYEAHCLAFIKELGPLHQTAQCDDGRPVLTLAVHAWPRIPLEDRQAGKPAEHDRVPGIEVLAQDAVFRLRVRIPVPDR